MSKEASGERIRRWLDRQPIWVLLTVITAFITFISATQLVTHWALSLYHTKLDWKATEQARIDKLSVTETLDYLNSVLGQPITKYAAKDSSTYTKFIYRERGYWVVAYADNANVVQMLAITACGDQGLYPVINNVPLDRPVTLSKDYMTRGASGGSSVLGGGHYFFLQGATRPSYYYDVDYEAHPGRYQTVVTGNNQFCGDVVLPQGTQDALFATGNNQNTGNMTEAQIQDLRSHVLINTIVITAPYVIFGENGITMPDLASISVSYVDAGILTPPTRPNSGLGNVIDDLYKNATPYEVIQ